jgi:hypothetical protein
MVLLSVEGITLDISHMTYARVAVGASPGYPELHTVDTRIADFLSDHINDLLVQATKDGASPPARFGDGEAQALFRNLHNGTDEKFLESAHTLATRLISAMNGRMSEGLLVALRAETEANGRIAGLLKLQVVAEHGAVLQKLESGELELSAVSDMLEKPGDLEKGALVATSLPDGEVYCADRLSAAARYFPEAFGIRIFAKRAAATRAFFDIAYQIAEDHIPRIAEAWHTLQSGPTREVLAELGEKVPEITPGLQDEMVEALETAPRPVVRLDTTREVKETYKIGEITLSGPIDEIRQRVKMSQKPDGGWRITIDSPEKPMPGHR